MEFWLNRNFMTFCTSFPTYVYSFLHCKSHEKGDSNNFALNSLRSCYDFVKTLGNTHWEYTSKVIRSSKQDNWSKRCIEIDHHSRETTSIQMGCLQVSHFFVVILKEDLFCNLPTTLTTIKGGIIWKVLPGSPHDNK